MNDQIDAKSQYEHDMKLWRAEAELYRASKVAMFQAQIDFAIIAIKGITLINGGAALALLAFLGHVVAAASKHAATINGDSLGVRISVAVDLMPAMIFFMAGICAGVLTAALAYISQTLFTEFDQSESARKWANRVRFSAVVTASVGIIAFVAGGLLAADTFIAAFTPSLY